MASSVFLKPENLRKAGEGVADLVDSLIGQRISTRFPTAKGATEDPFTQDLMIDLEAMRQGGDRAFTANMQAMSRYPQLRTPLRNPDKRAEAYQDVLTENLLDLHERIPEDIADVSKEWYVGANRFASGLAQKHSRGIEETSGVIAAMSPQKDWYMNASLAERVMDIYHNPGLVTPDMAATARRIFAKPEHQHDLERALNLPWEDLSRRQRAMYIRAKDEAENFRGHRIMSPTGEMQDFARSKTGEPIKTGWGSLVEIEKAVSVLDDPSMKNISQAMGGQHKVRNFYNNIVDPFSPAGDVTIDTHAVAADLWAPYSGSSIPVTHNFGGTGSASSAITGAKGTYGLHADVYRRAADIAGRLPREMQSITWEGVRGLFPATFKQNKKNVEKIDRIWEQFRKGDITLRQARDDILEAAGGIDTPDWARGGLRSGPDEGAWRSTYQEELPGVGISRADAPGMDRGTGVDAAGRDQKRAGLAPAAALGAALLGFMEPEEAEAAAVPAITRSIAEVLSRYGRSAKAGADKERAVVDAFNELRGQFVDSGRSPAVFDRRVRPGRGRGPGDESRIVWEMPEEYRAQLDQMGVSAPDLIETTDAAAFHQAISSSKEGNRFGASVYVYPEEEYRGMRLFMTEDGKAGYALKDDDIVSVFNTTDSPHKGVAYPFLLHAVEQGGKRLDAFDTVLPGVYSRMGFEEVARNAWDDAYMPEGWDKGTFGRWNQGEPDVSYMGYREGPASPLAEHRGLYDPGDPRRQALLEAGEGDITDLQRGSVDPIVLGSLAAASSAAAMFEQRRSQKRDYWRQRRQELLQMTGDLIASSPTTAALLGAATLPWGGPSEDASFMERWRDIGLESAGTGLFGLNAAVNQLRTGEDTTSALQRAAEVIRQPREELARDYGDVAYEITGSPLAATGVYTGTVMADPF